jgi:hypothetical protein
MLPFDCIRQTLHQASEIITDPSCPTEMAIELQRLINLYAEPPYPDWHYQVAILGRLHALASEIDSQHRQGRVDLGQPDAGR